MKILLAEDEKVCQNAIKNFAAKFGVNLDVANNGIEAFDFAKTNSDYTAILMDLGMDPWDGYMATKEIRALSYGGSFNIIALSGGKMMFLLNRGRLKS